MEDLVKATGVSRHGIYSDTGGKRDLFLETFAIYQREVVSPAFAAVEADGAGSPKLHTISKPRLLCRAYWAAGAWLSCRQCDDGNRSA